MGYVKDICVIAACVAVIAAGALYVKDHTTTFPFFGHSVTVIK